MTTEEKARRYDKALDIARDYHSKGYMMINTAIETIFPELKESEDERIRKELIAFIERRDRSGYDYDYDKWIAWLKKQREEPKKVSIWKHWKDGIAGNGEGEQAYLIKVGNTYSISSCLSFECDYIELSELDTLMIEKQGEQKDHQVIDIDKMVESYANNKEPGNEEFGKPVPCMIRAYRQGVNDIIKKIEQKLGVKNINIS